VYLLGGVRLEVEGRVITQFRSQKVALLLAYLLVHRERIHSRIELATLFYPDYDESRARTYLRITLYQLKKTLKLGKTGKPHLLITPQAVGFNTESDYWLDVEEFETLLERSSRLLRQPAHTLRLKALRLYRGDLLAGYYEDWILRDQESLRLRYQEALRAEAEYEEAQGDFQKAIEHLHRLLALSPLQEEIHRRLIRLFLRIGDSGAAWKQYRLCERLLAAELGVTPDPETQALQSQLQLQLKIHRPPSQPDPTELAYRELSRGQQALTESHLRAAERLLQAARRRLAELRDPAEAEALFQLGQLARKAGKLNLAKRRFARAHVLARRYQDTALQALALNGLGAIESTYGRLDQARGYYQRALTLAEKGHHAGVHWRALNNLGRNHWLLGRYDEALRCYVKVQLLCEQLSERRGLLVVLQNLGTLYSHLGLFAEAHRCYEEAQTLAEGAEGLSWQRSLWHNWGDVYERQGDLQAAARCYRQGYAISWELNDALGCAASLCNLGRVHGVLGDLRRAERYLTQAVRRARGIEVAGIEVEAYSALAQVRSAQGRPAEALEFSACAVRLLEQGAPIEEPEGVYLVHAEILKEAGDHAAARGALEKAWALLQQRASRLQREDYRRSFLENVPKHRQIQALKRMFRRRTERDPDDYSAADHPTSTPFDEPEFV
jgi:DNA-binding SARP family transcriptional activator